MRWNALFRLQAPLGRGAGPMGSNAKKVSELWRDQCVQSMEVKLLCKVGNSCFRRPLATVISMTR